MNVEVGNLHNGLFAILDAFGIIGAVFFVIGILGCLSTSFVEPSQSKFNRPSLRWVVPGCLHRLVLGWRA